MTDAHGPNRLTPSDEVFSPEPPRHSIGRRYEFEHRFFDNPVRLTHYALYQIGEYSSVVNYQSGSHEQTMMELSYFIDGSGRMLTDDASCAGGTGSVFFIPRGGRHMVMSEPDSSIRMFYLGFEFEESASEPPIYARMRAFFEIAPLLGVADRFNMDRHITTVLSELFNRSPGYAVAVENCVEMILLLAWRNFAHQNRRVYAPVYNELSNIPAVYSIVRYIDEHIDQLGDVRSIAAELGFSYAYLSHLFSSKTGIKLQDYICRRRMELAKQILMDDTMSIAAVARHVGYQSGAAFTRAFNRTFGLSPSEYIKSKADLPTGHASNSPRA